MARALKMPSGRPLQDASRSRLLDFFEQVEDLLKRVADSEDMFLRQSRAQVHSKLIEIKEEILGG